jgi:phosphotransferase system IIB component
LKSLGARGILRPSNAALQVVLGPIADVVAVEIRDALAVGGTVAPTAPPPTASAEPTILLTEDAGAALGGSANIRTVTRHPGRLRVEVANSAAINETRLQDLSIRTTARPAPGQIHLLGDDAALSTLIRTTP